ncbi:MAG TPA: xanthine dehydrogenase family protein subunit M [Rhodospirillales bacterium]|jgi:carbon-monoxide dehydrogenase medium subunit|nr:xanthine dehydrogenase family protein subunit M [Rhodospirillales bacterium]MDP7623337.1 xanthine dehydrogenase family protein subunit M [Rhodospirillales bacterium]HJO87907.1 xanthine dehydrogenase family protein subunit M [Rhodospirillales bacterium]|tara:strand:+ start:681 stop:1520 length:840 start_codon:yes stop_codon:yes gene_type:complete
MKIHKPTTLQEAAGLLAADDGAQCIAGGATLVAMMNSGVVEPSALISLEYITGLNEITKSSDGSVIIGASAKHKTVAAYVDFSEAQNIVGIAADKIAHPPIRNMGTIGGSVVVGDPAADYPTALLAAEATINIVGQDSSRSISAEDFFDGFLSTALEEDELVQSIQIPAGPENAVAVYDKIAKIAGDIAILSVAVVIASSGDSCDYVRIAVGGCGPTPYRVPEAEAKYIDGDLDAAIELLVAASDPMSDVRGSAEYRRKVLPRVLRRALTTAQQMGGRE